MNASRPAALFLMCTGILLSGTACSSSTSDPASSQSTTGSLATATLSEAESKADDVAFAQNMIPHHQQAIVLSDLALSKSTNAQIKTLATQIKAAQQPEITTMQQWLREWNAPASATPKASSSSGMMDHSMHGMVSDADMAALRQATGTDFDNKWLAAMISHHEGAVDMATSVLGTTRNDAVRTMATAIVTGQQKEIATMKGMQTPATNTSASTMASMDDMQMNH